MANPLRWSGLAVAGLVLLGGAGCEDGTPADGERVVLPSTYKAREKEIADGFLKSIKTKRAPRGRKAQPSGTRP